MGVTISAARWPLAWIEDVVRDVRYALRLLRREPLFTATAALSIAIGIGGNITIFTVANALLFRKPAGVVQPERLVDIGRTRGGGGFSPSSYPTYLDIRERAKTLEGVYAYSLFPQALSMRAGIGRATERVYGTFVTTSYFSLLGATPAAGRLLGPQDTDRPGGSPFVVLSYSFWERRFNRDPSIVGEPLTLNHDLFTVIGVAAQGFQGTGVRGGDVWVPINMMSAAATHGSGVLTNRAAAWLLVGGRLKPDVSVEQASAELDNIGQALAREYPEQNRGTSLHAMTSSPVPGNSGTIGAFLALLMGLVSLVLAIACANLTGVLLARAVARRREIAVRLTIGAWRGRLIRQLLAETLLLFAVGGGLGLLIARAMTSLLLAWLPMLPFPIDVSLSLDARVILFTMALALIAALLSGLAPALQASKLEVATALKEETKAPRRLRLRHAFLIAQVALSMLLVVVAGLLGRALLRMGAMDPGFDAHGVELVSLDLSLGGYNETTGPPFAHDLLDRVRRIPGVQSATVAAVLPGGFERIGLGGLGRAEGGTINGERFVSADWNIVEPGYFATLKMPLLAGRDFNGYDRAGTPPVTIVGEGVAKRFWPGQSAIGKYVLQRRDRVEKRLLVVGVARDPTYGSLVDGYNGYYIYLPLQQEYLPGWTMLAVRGMQDQPITDEVRAIVASMNPSLPVVTAQPADEYTSLGLLPQRIAASLSGSLGLVGLLLVAIGIYGVTAYMVVHRTREIGIRIALGAQRADVVRMVLREGMSLTLIGSAIGLILAGALGFLLTSLLFGIQPVDPLTFSSAAALFVAISLTACYVPARRATRIAVLDALRHE